MPDTQTPAPEALSDPTGRSVAGPEPGCFGALPLSVTLLVNPECDPLPEVSASNGRARVIFDDSRALVSIVIATGSPHAQAAYLYALGASISALAREVEGR